MQKMLLQRRMREDKSQAGKVTEHGQIFGIEQREIIIES